ncbi:MAG: hypothetical protein ACI8T1_001304 [Verrucomicrobiales bacterium]|jgi:hypothetical protein
MVIVPDFEAASLWAQTLDDAETRKKVFYRIATKAALSDQ